MTAESLPERLAALEERVARLEAGPQTPRNETFWALEGLRERLTGQGQVLFTGALDLPTGEHYEWQQGAATDGLLEADWAEYAAAYSALGHPVRLTLLRAVLQGTRSAAELQETAGLNTTGQLYHHLKQLTATGWLNAEGRGHYHVPAGRVVPLLVLLSAVVPPGKPTTGE
ncbi:ArsR/SmtB family transcription factor [Streptomyces sporangiiformans]|uniref:Winged helix-turn-helix transcriptional regulator n=1 Tax=Streptomyces sporangiiformans TaxID=2315329 RepID=A0A505DDM7_9ACTN|nr:helix-turn-helix domain-containing protein [Streptomyces sporangiiformans]TPQ22733.1 winged helix-turn-helix transcriptional regulator [Streptomyces sporangiiformans]